MQVLYCSSVKQTTKSNVQTKVGRDRKIDGDDWLTVCMRSATVGRGDIHEMSMYSKME